MAFKFIKFCLFYFFSYSLSAATFHQLDTTKPLKCLFSFCHHNRIMIEDGRVNKIIYPEENLSIRLEEHSGQAFIYAVGQILQPITLAVITDSGLVQDIEIEFANIPSEVVILKESCETSSKEQEVTTQPHVEQSHSHFNYVNEILEGHIPSGYTSCVLERKKWHLKQGIQMDAIVKLESCQDTIYIYEVSNISRKRRHLEETELACEGSLWVFLETNALKPKEKILAIVCIGKS